MNKVYGTKPYYSLVRQDGSRTIVSFGLILESDGEHYTWYECYWYKKPHPIVTIKDVKNAIITGINEETKTNIIEKFYYQGKNIWLSEINQFNYKAAYDLALDTEGDSLPYLIKVGEEDKPEYIKIETIGQFKDFYLSMISHIKTYQQEAWSKKDSIDWSIYEKELNRLYDTRRT